MTPDHAHSQPSAKPKRSKFWPVLVAVVAVLAIGVAAGAGFTRSSNGRAVASPTSSLVGKNGLPTANGSLTIDSVTPADASTQIPTDTTISVNFSAPLKADSPTPSLTPAVPGSWHEVTPTTFAFVAAAPLVPSSTVTVTIPGGPAGVVGAAGKHLAQPSTVRFTVAPGSTLRLQQLLAQLGYLPLNFTAAGPLTTPQAAAQPQEGTFTWRWDMPASLQTLWTVGTSNVITTGAVMVFESQHNLTTDGIAGPVVWQKLLADASAGVVDATPYNYVSVSMSLPERATVYSDGAVVYSTLANTGVPAAPTEQGTFPVYVRYLVTTMSGTNPDGSKYVDPGIPWVSYFNGGDALHGFIRSSYGSPQSDGCVEMPPANAAVVYPLTPIGTLVTVS